MKAISRLLMVGLLLLGVTAMADAGVINIYVGYLNNLSGPPNPADIPTPFDPSGTTILISSGLVADPHDTGVIRFENLTGAPITINPGVSVTTQGAVFQIWDAFLPFVLGDGMNLVLAETVNFNFDSSDFGLGIDPIVSFSINGTPYSFTDTDRVLLGHEEAINTPETTPYGLLGTVIVERAPEPGTMLLLGAALLGIAVSRKRN